MGTFVYCSVLLIISYNTFRDVLNEEMLHSNKNRKANAQQEDSKRMTNDWTANGCPMFGQQTVDRCSYRKLMTNVWSANGYKSAHATVCAIRHWSTFCCPFDVFPVIIACILIKVLFSLFSVNFLFLFVPIYRSNV